MGYTHYWKAKPFTAKAWRQATLAIKELTDHAIACGIDVAKEYDNNEPAYFGRDHIQFNGIGEKGHETFWLDRSGEGFAFCKTAYKPYDIVVTAALIYLHSAFGFHVTSDGDSDDWQQGLTLAHGAWPDLADRLAIPSTLGE